MNDHILSVREMQLDDIRLIVDYWHQAEAGYLTGMGVDLNKIPSRQEMSEGLTAQFNLSIPEKRSYCMIWELDHQPIGHSNTNPTTFGKTAFMHLHIWDKQIRRMGLGQQFIQLTLPHFFNTLKLQTLYCEPYALNPAPNKTMEKFGFDLVMEYNCIPGSINFEQPVKRWAMSKGKFERLNKSNVE